MDPLFDLHQSVKPLFDLHQSAKPQGPRATPCVSETSVEEGEVSVTELLDESGLEGEEVEVRVPISLRRESADLGMLHILR